MKAKNRYFKRDNIEVIEFEPGYRTITIYNGKFHLWFPYIIHIIRRHIGGRTMHMGLRVAPLNEKNILEETLMYPPLPNIFCDWLLACSTPSVEAFWSSNFSLAAGWPSHSLMLDTDLLSYGHWEKLDPKELVPIFCNWPKTIKFSWASNGLPCGEQTDMPVQMPLKRCLGPIDPGLLGHVFLYGNL